MRYQLEVCKAAKALVNRRAWCFLAATSPADPGIRGIRASEQRLLSPAPARVLFIPVHP